MKKLTKKRFLSLLLAVVMLFSLMPTASAAKADISVSVDAGDSVSFARTQFREIFDAEEDDESFYLLEFTDTDDLDEYGYFVAYDGESDKCELDEDDLDGAWFYYASGNVPKNSDYALNNLTFVAYDDAEEGTLTLKYLLVGEDGAEVDGTLEISIGAGSGDIVYEAKADSTVTFDAEDFYDYFDDNCTSSSATLRYVVFDKPASSDLANASLYYNYGKSSAVEFTRTTFANATFYYDDSDYGDYPLSKLSFVTDDDFEGDVELSFRAYYSSSRYVDGTVLLTSSSSGIVYEVEADSKVTFDAEDFYDYFEDNYSSSSYSLRYVVFDKPASSDLTNASLYYNYNKSSEVEFTRTTFANATFYYDSSSYGDYPLSKLSFVTDDDFDEDVELSFRAYYSSSRYVDGTVTLECADSGKSSSKNSKDVPDGDLEYTVEPGKEFSFSRSDFRDLFDEEFDGDDDFYALEFTGSTNLDDLGYLYAYDVDDDEVTFDEDDIEDATFYYSSSDIDDDDYDAFYLNDLTFAADKSADEGDYVELEFTLYGEDDSELDGTVVITIGETVTANLSSSASGDIFYQTTTGTSVQLKAADFASFLQDTYPTSTLQYVKLTSVPSTGSLYYNYYAKSSYGSSASLKLTSSNCASQFFYLSPSAASQYALSELTYIPSGNNYCAAIGFTAYGSGSKSVSGKVLISVSTATVPEVYGVITTGTAVSFPAPSLSSAVTTGTGSSLYGIQLLSLPDSSEGTIYVGSGTTRTADTSTIYGYSSGTWTISQLRFVPKSGFTGNVEIPYLAYNSSTSAVAVGKFCLGYVTSQKKFTDVTSSTWCYKYVSELADSGVISGYSDGSFKPDSTISYGAALKLIMLAAGYEEQAPTGSNVFSGYLDKARADGIITRSNVNLSGSITRLQVAQIAAGALKLDLTNLPSTNSFTDTTSESVRALNAIGIVEGYFSGGTYAYKPNNTLTRGQVSAIVWRMQNYLD